MENIQSEKEIFEPFSNEYYENGKKEKKEKEENAKDFTKQFIDNIVECICPLYKKINVANKWSFDVAYYMNTSIRSLNEGETTDEYTEIHLTENITPKTFSHKIKDIVFSAIILIGKLSLQYGNRDTEIDKILSQIKHWLYDLDYMRSFLDSWLYYEAEYINSEDYADLCDAITETAKNFSALYKDYKSKNKDFEFGYIPSNNIPGYAACEIEKTKLIYDKLLQFDSKVINLDFGDVTYPYWEEFQQFGKNLYDKLVYSAGMAYMDTTGSYNIEEKERKIITRIFERLERKCLRNQMVLSYIFDTLKENSNYGSSNDKELLKAYEVLKTTVKNAIFSSWN